MTGTLNFGAATPNSTSVITGGPGTTGATLASYLDVAVPAGTINGNCKVAIGANTLNFESSTPGNKFNIQLLTDGGLNDGQGYQTILATSTTGTFSRNGNPYDGTTNAFNSATDFNVVSGPGLQTYDPNSYSLSVSSNNLVLNFQPTSVPEPGTVRGLAAAGLGLAGWIHRRRNAKV